MTCVAAEGLGEMATSCGEVLVWQAPASALSISSMTAKSALAALSNIWTRTVACFGSSVKLTWSAACQGSEVSWAEVAATATQGRAPAKSSPLANTATTAKGIAEARILKRNMGYSHQPGPWNARAYGWRKLKESGYRRVDGRGGATSLNKK